MVVMSCGTPSAAELTAAETAAYVGDITRALAVLASEHRELSELAYLLGMVSISADERAKVNGSVRAALDEAAE